MLYKKITIFIIISITLINLSCLNSKDKKKSLINNKSNIEVIGLIEIDMDNKICIIENWDSKSRISYYIKGKYEKELSKNTGLIVKVKGKIIEEKSPWTKVIEVNKIIEYIK